MSYSYDFLKECQVFYLITINNGKPAGRPFGFITEYNGELYFTTGKSKEVYRQLKQNSNIQIVALKLGTRNWLRIDADAIEVDDLKIKQKLFEENAILKEHFSSAEDDNFALLKVVNKEVYINIDGNFKKIN